MTPVAHVEHQIRGRIRLRIPSMRGDGAYFETLRQQLADRAGVVGVSANPLTGSLLVVHSGHAQVLVGEAARNRMFRLSDPEPLAPSARPPGRKRRLPDLGSHPVAAGLSGLALYQVARGQALGSASEAFWNAYTAQKNFNDRPLSLVFVAIGLWQLATGQWLGSAAALFFYAGILQRTGAREKNTAGSEP